MIQTRFSRPGSLARWLMENGGDLRLARAWTAFAGALCFLSRPNFFDTSAAYSALDGFASEQVWAALLLSYALLDLGAWIVDRWALNAAASSVAASVWAGFAVALMRPFYEANNGMSWLALVFAGFALLSVVSVAKSVIRGVVLEREAQTSDTR